MKNQFFVKIMHDITTKIQHKVGFVNKQNIVGLLPYPVKFIFGGKISTKFHQVKLATVPPDNCAPYISVLPLCIRTKKSIFSFKVSAKIFGARGTDYHSSLPGLKQVTLFLKEKFKFH